MSKKPTVIEESIPADIVAEIAQAPQRLNLPRYDNARTALAALHRVDEVKDHPRYRRASLQAWLLKQERVPSAEGRSK